MDNIQRKLNLIDFELAGTFSLLERTAGTCPLLFAAVGFSVGIIGAAFIRIGTFIFLTVIIASTVFAVLSFIFRKDSLSPLIFAFTVFAGFIGLGGVRINTFYEPAGNDVRNLVVTERKLAMIRGIILDRPRVYQDRDWEFSKFSHANPSSSFYLDLKQVEASSGWMDVEGMVRVQVSEPVMDLRAGDYIEGHCWLNRFEGPKNPGQFNFARYLANKGVYVGASINSRDAVSVLNKESGFFTKLKNTFREKVTQALLSDTSIEKSSKSMMQALLLGYRGDIERSTYEAFRETGLLHFISLSGMHLGILAGFIWWLCKAAGLLKRARAVICITALCAFLLIVPPRAATLRAAIICFVFCLSFLFQRRTSHLNSLSLAAIVLLLIRPTGLFEAGWQLSFSSVLGILIFTDRIHFFINEKTGGWAWLKKAKKTNLFLKIVSKPADHIFTLFCVGVSAWLGGAGILLYHFYTINPLTSLWTVAAFPLVALILVLGYLKIVISFLLPTFSFILGLLINGVSALLIWMVKFLAGLNISEILIGHVPVIIIIIYYCLLVFVVFVHIRRPIIKQAVCFSCVLMLLLFLGALKWQRTHRNSLFATVLNVGHGQAVFVQMPGGENVLFDAGSLNVKDAGQRAVVPFLTYNGINKIDAIIISHDDIDHINGIPEIVNSCKVQQIYASETVLNDVDEWGTIRFLKSFLAGKGFDIQKLSEEIRFGSGAEIRFIWPRLPVTDLEDLSDNDKSLVSLIKSENCKILLCSDIEKKAQRRITELYPELKCDAMVVPHHGLVTTLEENFAEKLGAQFCICSCDRRQFERHKAQKNNNWLYTAVDGAIEITLSAKGDISVSPLATNKSTKR
ncbi:MAG: ComEC/Rec2 family competence protein [Planctomycetota bacterium]|jgi:competence protein ComEC